MKFLITEEEKSKILRMYYKNMGKTLVKEGESEDRAAAGINQITSSEGGGDMTVQIIDTNRRTLYYSCMVDPRLKKSQVDKAPYLRAGSIYDSSGKDMKGKSSLTGNWEKIVQKGCAESYKFVDSWREQNCPKLSEKTHWNYANECKAYIENKAQVAAAETSADASNPDESPQPIPPMAAAAIRAGNLTWKEVDGKIRYISTGKAFTFGKSGIEVFPGTDVTDSVEFNLPK